MSGGRARDEGLARVTAEILPENREMQRVCERLGFTLERPVDEPIVRARIDLASPPESSPTS